MAKSKDSLDRFNVSRIPPHGVSIRIHKDTPNLVDVIEEMHGYAVEELKGQLLVCMDERGELSINGPLEVTFNAICGRCGREIQWINAGEVDLIYLPDPGKGMKKKSTEQIRQELGGVRLHGCGALSGRSDLILDAIGEHVFMELPSVLRCDSEALKESSECNLPEIDIRYCVD